MMDTWQELTIEVKREAEEAASNILIELGSQGVAIDDSADYLGQVDQYGELFPEVEQSERVKITGYYPDSVDIEAVAAQANERLAELDGFGLETGDIQLTRQELAEEDWADNWKKYFEPARITHDLTIVPSWTEYEATAGEKIIKLDPGMAFGTGTHPTPVSEKEIKEIRRRMGVNEPKHDIDLQIDEIVNIVDGPFKGFEGSVSEIDPVKGKIKVLVSMFGRDTSVELDVLQVKKI